MFQKLTHLIRERANDRVYLKEATKIKEMQTVWEKDGLLLFPENLHRHLQANVQIARVQKNEIVIEVNDPHTKNALALQHEALKKLFEEKMETTFEAIRLTFPR